MFLCQLQHLSIYASNHSTEDQLRYNHFCCHTLFFLFSSRLYTHPLQANCTRMEVVVDLVEVVKVAAEMVVAEMVVEVMAEVAEVKVAEVKVAVEVVGRTLIRALRPATL
jgi:predicted ATPase